MIIVCPLNRAQLLVDEHDVSHVVSLLGPETPHRDFGVAPEQHLRLSFHDIIQAADGFSPPRAKDAEQLVSFLGSWDQQAPMLIHCWAGISRSTAAAYTAMCLLKPKTDEEELAWQLRDVSPSATPNRLIISFTDRLLGREGRMVRAVEKIGRGEEAFEGTPFFLDPAK